MIPRDRHRYSFWAATIFAAALLVFVSIQAARRTVYDPPTAPVRATLPSPDMRLDLNNASEAELMLLPGVGRALAERIVEEREAGGLFASIDDVSRVHGIGARTIERFRRYLIEPADDVMSGTAVDDDDGGE